MLINKPLHHSSWTHELVSGAAGFAGMVITLDFKWWIVRPCGIQEDVDTTLFIEKLIFSGKNHSFARQFIIIEEEKRQKRMPTKIFYSPFFSIIKPSVCVFLLLAMKAYEDHVQNTGEQVSHLLMKEMLASLAAAEVDKLFESKGLDSLDREEAKHHAVQQTHQLADEKYGYGGTFDGQSDHPRHHQHHQHNEQR